MIKNIAVTGTKGKSTVLRLIEKIFLDLSRNVYGTYGIDGYFYNQQMLRDGQSCENYLKWNTRKFPADVHLSEATSFVLDEGFYTNYKVDIGLFTSFDETEHAEIHVDPNHYLSAKRKLFDSLKPNAKMIVNRDIKNYSKIIEDYEDKVISYGLHPESDYVIKINMMKKDKMLFSIKFNGRELFFQSKILGEFNAKNIAAAFAASIHLNLDMRQSLRSLESFAGFDGRMERYFIPKTKTDVIIDYAHTYESLESLLQCCKQLYPERDIITIFGCGGDKSKVKRPMMGRVSEKYSTISILTNDNPRSENPADIVAEIRAGFTKDNYYIILDREEAIKSTLSRSNNAIVVIAGKGAEEEISINDLHIYHNDRNSLSEWCFQNNLTLVSYT